MSLAFSPQVGEAAHQAMSTLRVIKGHQRRCRQCAHDPGWCNTYLAYERTYKHEAATWERLALRAGVTLEVHG